MIFPELNDYSSWPLLLLRIIVGIVFITSGWSHFTQPEKRSESIGMSKSLTFILGLIEVIASVGLILGIYVQIAALLLIGVMIGAISKKIFVWDTGFYAEKGFGWHYDSILLAANLVFLFTGGGNLVII
ncbi:hypothetical protein C7S20_07345 [Christiangramia fulva]|uniref:DoxX family protein n=1 Tax=Christiangramia fulva TaxID=2126553 RepID=A0A2R3Z4E0_9FLAO|nr:DoxX family protein [Christiangramia fulva]AVR45098.1 hypothetical protein C7S20_07345 [Christiangramia fulva]